MGHAIFCGKGFSPAEDDAVGGDQRNKDAEDLIQLIGEGLHQQFDAGGQGGNDHHEHRQAHGIGDLTADQRHGGVGGRQYQGRGDAHAEGVDHRVTHPQ